jgi:hypothetical protein
MASRPDARVRRARRLRPDLDALEARALLSTGVAEVRAARAVPAARVAPAQVAPPVRVARVQPLDGETLLVRLRAPVPAGVRAEDLRLEVPGLEVDAIEFRANRTQLLVTTSPQEARPYELRLGGTARGRFAGSTLDPTEVLGVGSTGRRTVLVVFSRAMGPTALNPRNYAITAVDGGPRPTLRVIAARFLDGNRNAVELTTAPQNEANYRFVAANLNEAGGRAMARATDEFLGTVAREFDPATLPRVVGAVSPDNTTVLVSFSKPMSRSVLDLANYVIRQANVNSEAGRLPVLAAAFANRERTAVRLTTVSQNELTYALQVVNAADLAGNLLAPVTIVSGAVVDPSRATFPGTPPSRLTFTDADADGLLANEEVRGWTVVYVAAGGERVRRAVTSDPNQDDTDGDGLTDLVEGQLKLDPRDPDTDDDTLTDYTEYNETFSSGLDADSDDDGIDDGTEFTFFRSSPNFADSDGDQIPDGDEVGLGGPRNVIVADLPRPALEVGEVALRLDVRFTEATARERRELDAKSVTTTLSQSQGQLQSNSNASSYEFFIGAAGGYEPGQGGRGEGFIAVETGFTGNWSFQSTTETSSATERAYDSSLATEAEVTEGATVSREVVGARMQVGLTLKNASTLAYRVKNLQVAAFLQDPRDPGRLTPVATLLPDAEPDDGFALGPLVPERGPIILSSDAVFPALVESLMQNPRGLVFRFANFDILDESGRNFAFTSQSVLDRTGLVVIDYGGFDTDGDGEGDLTEYQRVGVAGGRVIDTSGDGRIGPDDRRVTFDATGRQVGITLRDALAAAGLEGLDEDATPAATLTAERLRNSYSTRVVDGVERIVRVRATAQDAVGRKFWALVTPTGIDPVASLDNQVLRAASSLRLALVQDLDDDLLPASLEYLLGTSDTRRDTDGDRLDDRFETLIGWDVDTPRGRARAFASGVRADSDRDGLGDLEEAPARLFDRAGNLVFDATAGTPMPAVLPLIERAERSPLIAPVTRRPVDVVTDPLNRDTDADEVGDGEEVRGFDVTLRGSGGPTRFRTDPSRPDTDDDGAPDGLERRLGTNPTVPDRQDDFADSDGDGLINLIEREGWSVAIRQVSLAPGVQGPEVALGRITSDPDDPDSDDDGLRDAEEFRLGTDPRSRDTDNDLVFDLDEVRGLRIQNRDRDLGVVVLDPLDADVDNDLRSDGAEAEVLTGEAGRWVVRPVGRDPYRGYSSPIVADADLDGLADGLEFAQGSDPAKADTDGDGRDDRRERNAGTNPLVEDVRVTVVFSSLLLTNDGDPDGGNLGDIVAFLRVMRPTLEDPFGVDTTGVDGGLVYSWDDQFGEGVSLPGVPVGQRSLSFSLARGRRFGLTGEVAEADFDPDANQNRFSTRAIVGGIDFSPLKLNGTSRSAVLRYEDVVDLAVADFALEFDDVHNRMTLFGGTTDSPEYKLRGAIRGVISVG